MLTLLLACASPPSPSREPTFVRGAWITSEGEGRRLSDGRVLADLDWKAGERHGSSVAPQMAECVPLFSADLGDVDGVVLRGGEPPDTALAFSPDGDDLLVGTYRGDVSLLDAWTGEVRAHRHLAETLIRRVAFSADAETLYVAEQSPDAFLHALDRDLNTLWSIRLADEVGSSTPASDDLYAVYGLPAAYAVEVMPDGDLLVAATHGWDTGHGWENRSRLLRVSAGGDVLAAWPASGAADTTILSLAVHEDRVVVPLSRSASGPAPPEFPAGGLVVLALPGLSPVEQVRIEPLAPWFSRVFVWESIAATSTGATAGLGDGRVLSFDWQGASRWSAQLGTPILVGQTPISASIGHLVAVGPDAFAVVTSGTNIPYGAADPSLRPPSAHPKENTLWMLEGDQVAWSWTGPQRLQGLSAAGPWLVAGAGLRNDDRRDLFGALVFDLRRPGSGADRLAAFCDTASPVFFRHAVHEDGRIAVAEHPRVTASGVEGAYRLTVFR